MAHPWPGTANTCPNRCPAEPLELAAAWLADATRREVQPNPNAMVLATADASGRPSARVVLCKQITPQPGFMTFYTNYHSRKGRELEARVAGGRWSCTGTHCIASCASRAASCV
jgi:pyridoxine/pyridoxamine 5'-phosphate oxidase